MNRVVAQATALALFATLHGAAQAETSPAPVQTAPPFVMPPGDEEIDGRIAEVSGKYELHVRDDRGFMDDVTLHRGTIITPAGLTLKPGMVVRIAGVAAGKTFAADLIVTPFVAIRPHAGFSLDDCAGASNAGPNPRPTSGPPGPVPGLPPASAGC